MINDYYGFIKVPPKRKKKKERKKKNEKGCFGVFSFPGAAVTRVLHLQLKHLGNADSLTHLAPGFPERVEQVSNLGGAREPRM